MLFPLVARLKFDAIVIFVAVAFEMGWNRIDRFPVVALQHGSVLRELLAIKRENLVSRVGGYVVLQVKTRAVFSPVEGEAGITAGVFAFVNLCARVNRYAQLLRISFSAPTPQRTGWSRRQSDASHLC